MQEKPKELIKVLVVEDSVATSKLMTMMLNSDPSILVVGAAYNGKDAVDYTRQLKPDIITMDILMPVMDGYEATKQIMAFYPTPILIVTSSAIDSNSGSPFKALSLGALDVMDKNNLDDPDIGGKKLIEKVKLLSNIKVIRHPLGNIHRERKVPELTKSPSVLSKIVAIAASTGGPQALLELLKRIPKDITCSIVIVQHITSGFVDGLSDWLNNESQITVKTGMDGEELLPGTAYIAPSDKQMRVTNNGIKLSDEPPYKGFKPSGNILLESAAKAFGNNAIGVILTGMGNDGSEGIMAKQIPWLYNSAE